MQAGSWLTRPSRYSIGLPLPLPTAAECARNHVTVVAVVRIPVGSDRAVRWRWRLPLLMQRRSACGTTVDTGGDPVEGAGRMCTVGAGRDVLAVRLSVTAGSRRSFVPLRSATDRAGNRVTVEAVIGTPAGSGRAVRWSGQKQRRATPIRLPLPMPNPAAGDTAGNSRAVRAADAPAVSR